MNPEVISRNLDPVSLIDGQSRRDELSTDLTADIHGIADSAVIKVGDLPPGHFIRVYEPLADGQIAATHPIRTEDVTPERGLAVPLDPLAKGIGIQLLDGNGKRVDFSSIPGRAIFDKNLAAQVPLNSRLMRPSVIGGQIRRDVLSTEIPI